MSVHDDDEPETFPCYRHPDRDTALTCKDCERPICVDCAVQGAVGIKCPDCARTSRAARGVVPVASLTRGIVGAVIAAIALGIILFVARLPFEWILAFLGGMGVGEIARRASGGYRDPAIARAAVAACLVGVLVPPILRVLEAGGGNAQYLVFNLVAAAAAAFGASRTAN